MVIKLYRWNVSPVSRACVIACELFNVPVEEIDVNVLEGTQGTPEFLQMNPVHTVPVLDDNGFIIHDSHAILMYLADVYGKQDSYYPKDTKQRALVNQKLFFECSILFPRMRNITNRILFDEDKDIPQKSIDDVEEAYGFTEAFLSRTKYLAGENITIADIAAVATMTSLTFFVKLNEQKYPKTYAWFEELKKIPWIQKGQAKGMEAGTQLVKSKLG